MAVVESIFGTRTEVAVSTDSPAGRRWRKYRKTDFPASDWRGLIPIAQRFRSFGYTGNFDLTYAMKGHPMSNSSTGSRPLTGDPTERSLTTTEWLAHLPAEFVPHHMTMAFPHVASRIAELWMTPRLLDGYFDDLLVDRRGNRKGFPFRVAMEITDLRAHYHTAVFPLKSCLWSGQA